MEQVLEDANDALDWVQKHGASYGVSGKPALFGQSAVGHLAGVLSVEWANDIASAVLFYAPTGFTDFARQLIDGEIDTETGKKFSNPCLVNSLNLSIQIFHPFGVIPCPVE